MVSHLCECFDIKIVSLAVFTRFTTTWFLFYVYVLTSGVGDTIGIGPESTIPGCLESVSESNRAHPWNRYRNRSSVGQGISIGIGTKNPGIANSWHINVTISTFGSRKTFFPGDNKTDFLRILKSGLSKSL